MEAPRKSAGPPAFLQVSPMLQLWIELAFSSLLFSRAEQKGLCQRLAENPVRKSDHPSSSRQATRLKCPTIAGPFCPQRSTGFWPFQRSLVPQRQKNILTDPSFRAQLMAEKGLSAGTGSVGGISFSGSRRSEEFAVVVSVLWIVVAVRAESGRAGRMRTCKTDGRRSGIIACSVPVSSVTTP